MPFVSPHELPEQKLIKTAMIITRPNFDLFYKFSSLTKLLRIVALCLRFVHNARNKTQDRIIGRLTTQELVNANLHIIKRVQAERFAEELQNLQTKGRVPRKSNLLSLSPFLNQQGVM